MTLDTMISSPSYTTTWLKWTTVYATCTNYQAANKPDTWYIYGKMDGFPILSDIKTFMVTSTDATLSWPPRKLIWVLWTIFSHSHFNVHMHVHCSSSKVLRKSYQHMHDFKDSDEDYRYSQWKRLAVWFRHYRYLANLGSFNSSACSQLMKYRCYN